LASFVKLNKKAVLITIASICAVAICVGTTLAYLISRAGPVENVFTIGNIEISLTETTGSSYKLVPGKDIDKNPKVTVHRGSEPCYLFVEVKKSNDFDEYLEMHMADGWTHLGGYDGIYYRTAEFADIDLEFDILKDNKVTVRDNITEDKMSQISSAPTVSFVAYAIQSHGMDTVVDAWYQVLEEGSR
jgi:hypothetical protein